MPDAVEIDFTGMSSIVRHVTREEAGLNKSGNEDDFHDAVGMSADRIATSDDLPSIRIVLLPDAKRGLKDVGGREEFCEIVREFTLTLGASLLGTPLPLCSLHT